MNNIKFPIHFKFNIATFSNDFSATDANGETLAYVRQKMFKLKEDIEIFSEESKQNKLYQIKADRWLDFSAAYSFTDKNGREIGKIVRKGWRSMWKARYEIIDESQQPIFHINEKSIWTRIMDNVFGEIPILNFFTGYLFNPTYILTTNAGEEVALLTKEASMFGRKFNLTAKDDLAITHHEKIILGFMMMILLERRRG